MSVRSTVRALPTLLQVGFAEAVAYRAELFVWILATTMPLVMLALFSAVARESPIGRYGQHEFVAYFLVTFIVRQVTASWAAWQINFDIMQGTLSMRLLRPVHPLVAYAIENVAALPMRLLVALPVAIIALVTSGSSLTKQPLIGALFAVSLVGGWLVTLSINLTIGCLAFFMEKSLKVADIYLALYFVFSGYIVPIDLFPPVLRHIADALPFHSQIGVPVELLTGAYDQHVPVAVLLVIEQWIWVALGLFVTQWTWRRGLRRFAAYGG